MQDYFFLSRVLLKFKKENDDLLSDISAVSLTPDGNLWVGSDELLTLERLSPIGHNMYGKQTSFPLKNYLDLFDQKDEIDIEGMDYSDGYLWFTGSHSSKRKKPKGKKTAKDLDRLATIKYDSNRFLLGRVPVIKGELVKNYNPSEERDRPLSAASLEKHEKFGNILMAELRKDRHLSSFMKAEIPSKDNGLDIEGIVVRGNRIFLGLRGPVLRGWAIIIEIEVTEKKPGVLTLKKIGSEGKKYRKHFCDLNGLGIRELCFYGDDLIILAGPTMSLEGAMEVFVWQDVLSVDEATINSQEGDYLKAIFNLPFTLGSDHAEGLTLYPCLGQENALLVVYDSPDKRRRPSKTEIFADVFSLQI
ncbi:MAG: DUF3616 domain-containing protein [Jaaginema sp. PMC 1079.18]|nr:DUF3616 domain-containing protein [Jaaginema sp. PMC 1080.18]MEC4850935.1 DUF3616 domain-containing protein [Jaaginema sp. PMC 1079.18]MEC4865745.1 DUF3616 domain-containing protein [Jaaginema sp. PMC 1078.18]